MATNQLFISFVLNKYRTDKQGACPISMRVTVNGHRETILTGINIAPHLWDSKKGTVKGKSPAACSQNNLLNALKAKTINIYTDLLNSGMPLSSEIIKRKLTGVEEQTRTLMEVVGLHNTYVQKKVGVEVCKATFTKYETLRKKLEAYIQKEYTRKDLFLRELNQKFVINFELFLKVDQQINHNTTIKYVQFLKRVINFAIANDWMQYDPFKAFKCTFQPVIRECLNPDEIEKLQSTDISVRRLSAVRDIFLFSCYTGLAYADVKKLTHKEIVKGIDGKLWIQTVRAKTNTRVPIPLLPQALDLIERYCRGTSPGTLVFPVLSNQKMNAYLKEIGDICGIIKPLTFHSARHTFATTITLSNGVPIETVSKMLGHTNIKTTQIYSKVLDLKISSDMIQLQQKLSK
jgi:site-specific recombinase XerD